MYVDVQGSARTPYPHRVPTTPYPSPPFKADLVKLNEKFKNLAVEDILAISLTERWPIGTPAFSRGPVSS